MECPRCFYLDRRLKVSRPSTPPFKINEAVDTLFKKEFDVHRAEGSPHPLMSAYGVDAVPFKHEEVDQWRDSRGGGVHVLHQPTNLLVFGGIDDVWKNSDGELVVVDYKATSKNGEVTIETYWGQAYKRQLEFYQWLLRRRDFKVSDTGYFVYANGKTDAAAFDGKVEFDIKLIPYAGKDEWIEPTLKRVYDNLNSAEVPAATINCEYCKYYNGRKQFLEREPA